jgi:Tfp pilus assembly protein PilF
VSALTEKLEKLLAEGSETALVRFSLGNAYLADKPEIAAGHLERAVAIDPGYSAAWKLLGRALAACDRIEQARQAFSTGIETAERRGDIQAAKEMRVFLKRLDRAAHQGPGGTD